MTSWRQVESNQFCLNTPKSQIINESSGPWDSQRRLQEDTCCSHETTSVFFIIFCQQAFQNRPISQNNKCFLLRSSLEHSDLSVGRVISNYVLISEELRDNRNESVFATSEELICNPVTTVTPYGLMKRDRGLWLFHGHHSFCFTPWRGWWGGDSRWSL